MSKSNKWQEEWQFFINPKTGRIQYCDTCNQCIHDCKQSYKVTIVDCPKKVTE